MFRTDPLSIIRSQALYTQQGYMSYRFADSLLAGSGQNWFSSQNQISSILILVLRTKPVLSSGVFHCTHSNGMCPTGLLTACEQDQNCSSVLILLASCQQNCMTYTIAVFTGKNS